jgi:hypothetical protein
VEESSDLFVPVHKQLIEDVVDDVVIEGFLELLGEDIVVAVEDREHLNRGKGTIWRRREWLDSRMQRMPV